MLKNNISNRRRTGTSNSAHTHSDKTYSSMNQRSSTNFNKQNEKFITSNQNKQSNDPQSSKHKRRAIANAWYTKPYSNKHNERNDKESKSSSNQHNDQSNNDAQSRSSSNSKLSEMVNQNYIDNLKSRVNVKNNDVSSQLQENKRIDSSDHDQHNTNEEEITGYNVNMAKLKLLMKNSGNNLSELDSMRNVAMKCMDLTEAIMEENQIDFDDTEEWGDFDNIEEFGDIDDMEESWE